MKNLKKLNDVKGLISEESWKIFGISYLPETRSEIFSVLNVVDFEIICSKATSDLASMGESIKINVFEENKNSKKVKDIISNDAVIEYINSYSFSNKIAIYLFKSSHEIEEICRKNNWNLIVARRDLFLKVDSKRYFLEFLKKNNLERNFEVLKLEKIITQINRLFEEFGNKIVIQNFLGAGSGTFIVEKKNFNFSLVENFFLKDQELIVSSFIDGFDVSITGCVTEKNGILCGFARHQFVGVDAITFGNEKFKHYSCGNDWNIRDEYRDKIQIDGEEIVQKIGLKLKEDGFRGIFGLDFIFNKKSKKLVPLEVNPRIIDSYPIETHFEVLNDEFPLIACHVLEFLGVDYFLDEKLLESKVGKIPKENCSHVMLKNFFGKNVSFKNELKGGVYCVENERLIFLRNGFSVKDIEDFKREFVLTAGTPVPGYVYEKDKQLFRVIWRRSIQVDNANDIDSEAKKIISVIRKELELMVV